jgi:hypothetical protein
MTKIDINVYLRRQGMRILVEKSLRRQRRSGDIVLSSAAHKPEAV